MTAAKTDNLPADAPSHESATWHVIDWRKMLGNVRRLHARIVKATQAGKWHKVRALQRLLAHSASVAASSRGRLRGLSYMKPKLHV